MAVLIVFNFSFYVSSYFERGYALLKYFFLTTHILAQESDLVQCKATLANPTQFDTNQFAANWTTPSITIPLIPFLIFLSLSGCILFFIYFINKKNISFKTASLHSKNAASEIKLPFAQTEKMTFLGSAFDYYWETDEHLRITEYQSLPAASFHQNSAPERKNKAISAFFGKTMWEIAGIQSPEIDPNWSEQYSTLLDRKTFRDFIFTKADHTSQDRLITIRVSGSPFFDSKGIFKGYRGVSTNIYCREKTSHEKNPEIEEDITQALLDNMDTLSEGVSIWDQSLKLWSWNEQCKKILQPLSINLRQGISLEEIILKIKESKTINRKQHNDIDTFYYGIHTTRSSLQNSLILEFTTGGRFLVRSGKNSLGQYILTITDITLLKEKEAEVLHLQKMEILGQITGGVAHDFNNLLAVILGNLEFLKKYLHEAQSLKILSNVERSAQRAASLTQRLLAFARRQNLQPEIVSIQDSLTEIGDLLQSSLGGSIPLRIEVDEKLCDIYVDLPQLETALLNLAVNSKDAMPDGGEFFLRIENKKLNIDEAKSLKLASPGTYLLISCTDTGSGMDEEILKKATEPFYTTKEKNKGSGLGLSMVYGFIKQSGGAFRIKSTPGQGTTISMWLPKTRKNKLGNISNNKSKNLSEPSKIQTHTNTEREVILLVEDTPEILELTSEVLGNLGYRVIKANNTKLALQILETEHSIDLLLSDIILPGGISGFELGKIGMEMRPNLSVLFMSGYTPEYPSDLLQAKIPLLKKPFSNKELCDNVRYIFDKKHNESNLKTINS